MADCGHLIDGTYMDSGIRPRLSVHVLAGGGHDQSCPSWLRILLAGLASLGCLQKLGIALYIQSTDGSVQSYGGPHFDGRSG
jgi:hypothetical protein